MSINDRLPSDPELQRDISAGQGNPLSATAATHHDDLARPSAQTVLAAPPDYLQADTQSLRPCLNSPLTLQHEAAEVDIVRFYMDYVLPPIEDAAAWRRDSVREDGQPVGDNRPTIATEAPDSDTPQGDRLLESPFLFMFRYVCPARSRW